MKPPSNILRRAHNPMLTRRIRNPRSSTRLARITPHINNRTTALLLHSDNHFPHQLHWHRQIDRHDALPFAVLQRVGAGERVHDARDVAEDVDAWAECGFAGCDGGRDGVCGGQVGAVEGEIGCWGCWRVREGGDVDAEDVCAAREEEQGCCEADSAGAAGYYDGFAGEGGVGGGSGHG